MRNTRVEEDRWFTRRRVAAVVLVALVVVAGAALFVVRTRADLRDARDGLKQSQQNLAVLDGVQRDAVVERTNALAALERAHAALLADTSARDRLRATDQAELRRLTSTLETLSKHQVELASGEARAQLLDDCLVGASQVLNEAAVGDTVHLATTLPAVQQLCTRAAA